MKEWAFFTTSWLNFSLMFVSVMAMLLCNICVMLMCHSICYIGTSGFVETMICNIRLWQLKQTIASFGKNSYPSILYVMYAYRKTIQYSLEVNPLFGEAFMVYVVINFPTNAMLVMNIIMGVGDQLFRLGILIVAVSQTLQIFLIHYLIANQNIEMNSYSKKIFSLSFHRQFRKPTSIRLNLFIQAFYTNKMYGITYGKFGLISLSTFSKVIN